MKDYKHDFVDVESVSTDVTALGEPPNRHRAEDRLKRSLSARQVSMISLGGVIGTGLFYGVGVSLSKGGPASILIAYSVIGILVYLVMIALGEMAAYTPVAGSFCTYTTRFVDEALGFSLTWNYWANDAISTAADLTALQVTFKYWTDVPGWAFGLIFWAFVVGINLLGARAYGEIEYWLALLKVVTIVIFIIVGIIVSAGENVDHKYLGFHYWHIEGAPFVDGFRGWSSVIVTACFAYGGTESIGITAGEQKNPHRGMPRVVRTVFWRILIFYVVTVLIVGVVVPYNYPGLNTKSTMTSPFTIAFEKVGSTAGASFINAVVLTASVSAANHALYAGSRLMLTLGEEGYAPRFVTKLTPQKVPWIAVILTSLISLLCFGASFIGTGELWTWLQSLVGVSNQVAWLLIGVTSIRFRQGIAAQGRLEDLKYKNWTHPWGPWVVVILSLVLLLIQGWSSFSPWDVSNFFQSYVELAIVPVLYVLWKILKRPRSVSITEMDLETDVYEDTAEDIAENNFIASLHGWRKILYELKTYVA